MHQENGPPLPLGEQLRRGEQSKVFCTFYLLHSGDVVAIVIFMYTTIHDVREAGVERVLHVQPSGDGRAVAFLGFRGSFICYIHGCDAGNAVASDLERRNRHRAIEKRGGQMGP